MQTDVQVSVSELRNNLSYFLRLASEGTPVTITRHRRPLVRLQRIATTGDVQFKKLMQIEGTDWNGRKPRLGPGVKPTLIKRRRAADYVLDERG